MIVRPSVDTWKVNSNGRYDDDYDLDDTSRKTKKELFDAGRNRRYDILHEFSMDEMKVLCHDVGVALVEDVLYGVTTGSSGSGKGGWVDSPLRERVIQYWKERTTSNGNDDHPCSDDKTSKEEEDNAPFKIPWVASTPFKISWEAPTAGDAHTTAEAEVVGEAEIEAQSKQEKIAEPTNQQRSSATGLEASMGAVVEEDTTLVNGSETSTAGNVQTTTEAAKADAEIETEVQQSEKNIMKEPQTGPCPSSDGALETMMVGMSEEGNVAPSASGEALPNDVQAVDNAEAAAEADAEARSEENVVERTGQCPGVSALKAMAGMSEEDDVAPPASGEALSSDVQAGNTNEVAAEEVISEEHIMDQTDRRQCSNSFVLEAPRGAFEEEIAIVNGSETSTGDEHKTADSAEADDETEAPSDEETVERTNRQCSGPGALETTAEMSEEGVSLFQGGEALYSDLHAGNTNEAETVVSSEERIIERTNRWQWSSEVDDAPILKGDEAATRNWHATADPTEADADVEANAPSEEEKDTTKQTPDPSSSSNALEAMAGSSSEDATSASPACNTNADSEAKADNSEENSMERYVQSLVKAVKEQGGGECRLSQLGGLVSKPPSVRTRMKTVLERNGDIFVVLERPKGNHIVRLVATHPQPHHKEMGLDPDKAMQAYVSALYDALSSSKKGLNLSVLSSRVPKPSVVKESIREVIKMNADKFVLEKKANGTYSVHGIVRHGHKFDQSTHAYLFRSLFSISAYYDHRAWPVTKQDWLEDYQNGMGLDPNLAEDVYNLLHVEQYVKKKAKSGKLVWNLSKIQDAVHRMPDSIKALPLGPTNVMPIANDGVNITGDDEGLHNMGCPMVSSAPADVNGVVQQSPSRATDVEKTTQQSEVSLESNAGIIPDEIICSLRNQNKVWQLSDGSTCIYIDDENVLFRCVEHDPQLRAIPGNRSFVAVDCEGVPEALELVQIATRSHVYIFDAKVIGEGVVCRALQPLLLSEGCIKLMHDLHKDAAAFFKFGRIVLRGTLDMQLVGEMVWGEMLVGFNRLLEKLKLPQHPSKNFIHARMKSGVDLFAKRPIPRNFLEYAALDVSLLLAASDVIRDILTGDDLNALILASKLRAESAVANDGARAICFDAADGYNIASADLLRAIRPDDGFFGEKLVLQSETDDVIETLPGHLRQKLRPKQSSEQKLFGIFKSASQNNLHKNQKLFGIFPPPSQEEEDEVAAVPLDSLSDIILDIGRRPQCWVNDKRVFLCDDESKCVTADEVDGVARRLGAFGSDNRAGLDGKLHRFSAMRNRDGKIAGITIRIGRNVEGNAAMILDLLMGSDGSILILGEPGSGKTTIVRAAVCKLAETKNVVVVDTSNEIAGDGMIPHRCIGLARRMMVPSLAEQASVMVECVQNHTPHVMVIDEIGRVKEVDAARTVKQRGVRMIASAHGDLRKLLKNKDLRGLIGGVEHVTMGDNMAREEAQRKQKLAANGGGGSNFVVSKTKVQRGGEPTFEIIVEVRRGARHEWKIVTDSAKAVDRVLDGLNYKAQLRTRDPDTGTMTLELIDS